MGHPQGVVGAPPATSPLCPHTFQAASSSLWCPVPTSPSPPAFPALMGTPCTPNLFPSQVRLLHCCCHPFSLSWSILTPQRATKSTPPQCHEPSPQLGRCSAQREEGTVPRGVAGAPVLFLGSAPAPGDLCQVISLLCARASSRAARGSPGGMLPLVPVPSRSLLLPAELRVESRMSPSPCPDFGRGGGKATSFCWEGYPSTSRLFNAFPFQGWSGTEEPRWNITRERK